MQIIKNVPKAPQIGFVAGERYLPAAAITSLTLAEYVRTTAAKRRAKKAGKQFSKQPESIMKKARQFRKS